MITIKGQWASKKNSKRIVGKRMIASAAWMSYAEYAMHQLMRMSLEPADKVSQVTITFYPKDNVRRDLSNGAEGIMDLLVDAGALADDKWQVVPRLLLIAGGIDKANPRVEVEICK